jgi:CheY-like chemotaxis protein
MEQTLESGGFDVVAASSGDAALQMLIDSETQFAGLVTDIRLGDGIDGWALARKARELIPDLCVVYITGDSAADWPAKGVPGSMVLQKPFADALLLTGISTLLNERGRLP